MLEVDSKKIADAGKKASESLNPQQRDVITEFVDVTVPLVDATISETLTDLVKDINGLLLSEYRLQVAKSGTDFVPMFIRPPMVGLRDVVQPTSDDPVSKLLGAYAIQRQVPGRRSGATNRSIP